MSIFLWKLVRFYYFIFVITFQSVQIQGILIIFLTTKPKRKSPWQQFAGFRYDGDFVDDVTDADVTHVVTESYVSSLRYLALCTFLI